MELKKTKYWTELHVPVQLRQLLSDKDKLEFNLKSAGQAFFLFALLFSIYMVSFNGIPVYVVIPFGTQASF